MGKREKTELISTRSLTPLQTRLLNVLDIYANSEEGLLPKITSKATHISRHTEDPPEEVLLKKLKHKGMVNQTAASTFDPDVDITGTIEDTLYDVLPNISVWLQEGKEDKLKITLHPEASDRDKPLGKGFRYYKNVISEHTTDDITLYLKRTPKTKELPLGFYIVTAYPDILTETAKPTGDSAYDKIKDSPSMKSLGPTLQKRILKACTKPAAELKYTDKLTEPKYTHLPPVTPEEKPPEKTDIELEF